MADLAIVIVSVREADFLRQTLPRCKRNLPDSKFVVVHLSDDAESASISAALKVYSTVSVAPDVLTRNGATFNVSALISAGIQRVRETLKDNWIVLTRPQVVLESTIGAFDFRGLDEKACYGSFFEELDNQNALLRFSAKEPTASEVRDANATPSREFLMFKSQAWPSYSKTAAEGLDEFLSKFAFQFMVQLKQAHLGKVGEDAEGRKSQRWDQRHLPNTQPVRIAPVHPGANQQKEAEKKEEKREAKVERQEEKKKDEKVDVNSGISGATPRREVDEQNFIKPKSEAAAELAKAPTKKKAKNPFSVLE